MKLSPPPIAYALREVFQSGYGAKSLKADLLSGLVVSLVAIPLGMALAVASGVPPQHGLYTVIFAGGLIALLGGSRCQVSGPTASVVILIPIVNHFGLGGLLLAGFFAGMILFGLGFFKLGKFVEYIPYPVTLGFTTGIALVIAFLQLKDLSGIHLAKIPESLLQQLAAYAQNLELVRGGEVFVGAFTLGLLLVVPRFIKSIPAPLVALAAAAGLSWALNRWFLHVPIETIRSRFGAIPRGFPPSGWPWSFTLPGGQSFRLSVEAFEQLLPASFAIALLAAIESLLTAVVADGMSGTKHEPNSELMALGIGNMICPFLGGMPATGALARTATNIRFGAKSPFSSFFHAVYVLLALLVLGPVLGFVPMSALAALLLLIAYNMSQVQSFIKLIKGAPREDVAILLTTFCLTVVFDMVKGVLVGTLVAALLFIKKMSEVTSGQVVKAAREARASTPVQPELMSRTLFYQVDGPLFFGAAERAMSALQSSHALESSQVETVIIDLERVSFIDASGIVAFESVVDHLQRLRKRVIVVGTPLDTRRTLEAAGFSAAHPQIRFYASVEDAQGKWV